MKQPSVKNSNPEKLPDESRVTLDSIPHGLLARVLEIIDTSVSSLRLMEMGFVPGAPVSVVRSAPLGDPIQIRIRDYDLALRRGEARTIAVAISPN